MFVFVLDELLVHGPGDGVRVVRGELEVIDDALREDFRGDKGIWAQALVGSVSKI
jgi:hypothetical protein